MMNRAPNRLLIVCVLATIAPSVAATLFGALDYLTTYPYGCTEQTMSSFLPNIVVSRAVRDLGIDPDKLDPVAL